MTGQSPIIVLGCPRSGTTLLRRLLNAHPNIYCAGETFLLRGAVRFLSGERVAEGIEYGPLGGLAALGIGADEVKSRLRSFVLQFHEELAAGAGKPRFAMKTAVNSFYTAEIVDLFRGHARFVCLLRNGMDVAVSLRDFTSVMEGPIEELMPFVAEHRRLLPAFAAAWAKVTGDMVEATERFPDDMIALRYEDLVERPQDALTELFGFLGEPFDSEQLLGDAFSIGDVRGLGDYKTFATGELVADSIGRWSGLPDYILAEMAPIVNPLLERLGYERVEVSESASDAMRRHELAMMYNNSRTAR